MAALRHESAILPEPQASETHCPLPTLLRTTSWHPSCTIHRNSIEEIVQVPHLMRTPVTKNRYFSH